MTTRRQSHSHGIDVVRYRYDLGDEQTGIRRFRQWGTASGLVIVEAPSNTVEAEISRRNRVAENDQQKNCCTK